MRSLAETIHREVTICNPKQGQSFRGRTIVEVEHRRRVLRVGSARPRLLPAPIPNPSPGAALAGPAVELQAGPALFLQVRGPP